jgi:death on curing protein
MEPLFLTLDEVLEIHPQQIELYGGPECVRDPGGLESAIAMPMAFGGQFLHSTFRVWLQPTLVSHLPQPPVR